MSSLRRGSSIRALIWGVLAIGLITVLGTAEALLRHSLGQIAVMVLLPIAAYLLGRRSGRRVLSPSRPPRSRATSEHAELARMRDQVARFEAEAGRPIDAATASYEHIQSRYGGRP